MSTEYQWGNRPPSLYDNGCLFGGRNLDFGCASETRSEIGAGSGLKQNPDLVVPASTVRVLDKHSRQTDRFIS